MSGVIGGGGGTNHGLGREASMDRDFRPSTFQSRANPFVQGSTLNREADDVVQMFLANNGASANAPPGGADQIRNNQPGKIEDLPSPTGAFGQQQVRSGNFHG